MSDIRDTVPTPLLADEDLRLVVEAQKDHIKMLQICLQNSGDEMVHIRRVYWDVDCELETMERVFGWSLVANVVLLILWVAK